MNSKDVLLADAEVRGWNRSEQAGLLLVVAGQNFLGRVSSSLIKGGVSHGQTVVRDDVLVVGVDVGSGMADEEVDVLTIDTFVKYVNIVAFALLYFGDRFHQSLILSDTFSITIKHKTKINES